MKINSEYWISCILFPHCLTCCFLLVSLFPTCGCAFQCRCGSLLILQLISFLAVWISWLLWSGTKFKSRPRMRAFLIKKKIVYHSLFWPPELCVLLNPSGHMRIPWWPVAWCPSRWHLQFWKATSGLSSINPYLSVLLLLRDSKLVPFNMVCYELYQVMHRCPF